MTPNAPLIDDFFTPDEGNTITRLDIEGCAGDEPFNLNPIYWTGFLADNTAADYFIFGGDLPSIELAPGACLHGSIDLEVPAGGSVTSVVLLGQLFDEVARWDTTSSVPVTGPLVAPDPVEPSPVGSKLTLPDGSTAVVTSVVPNAPPLDENFPPEEGRQIVRIEVEQCAGGEPLSINPAYWWAAAADNHLGQSQFGGSTLPSLTLAAGECVAGTVEIGLAADAKVAQIILTNDGFTEAAFWLSS